MLSGLYLDTRQVVGESGIKLDNSAVGTIRREGAFRFLYIHNGGLLLCQIQPPQNDAIRSPLVLIQELVSPDSTSNRIRVEMDTLGVDEQTIEWTQPIATNTWNTRALPISS